MENVIINKKATIMILLALLPGFIFSVLWHDPDYLMASFFSVCAILPFGIAHSSKLITYLFAIILMFYSILTYHFIGHWIVFYIVLVVPMTLFSVYEVQEKSLKMMSNWWLIAVVYAGYQIQHAPTAINGMKYLLIFLLTLTGCTIALYSHNNESFRLPTFKIEKKHVRYYAKYPLALLITLSILELFNIQEGQWLIWSCFSVLSLDYAKAKGKYKQRLMGVTFGISVGLVIIKLTPYSPILEYGYIICILLSLRLFQSYLYSFATRCFFIVLYAGSNYQHIGYARLTDIALGGALGILLSYCLRNRDID